jgi:hypothetical protein
MTGFHQRQAISTLTAPGARGLSPHSLVQPDSRHALPSGHGNNYSVKKQKRLWMRSKTKEHHHNHSKATF